MKFLISIFFVSIANGPFGQGVSTGNFRGEARELIQADGISIPVYDFEGFKENLKPYPGQTLVVNFWATWCKPCVEELPGFIQLSGELEDKKISFLFVSLDFRKNLESNLIPFVKEHGLKDQVLMLNDPDANSWIDQVDPSWSGSIPATLVIKGDRKVFHEGQLSREQLSSIIQSI